MTKYSHEFQAIISETRYAYDNFSMSEDDRSEVEDLTNIEQAILGEVWELEGHMNSRIDDVRTGRNQSNGEKHMLDLSPLDIMQEVR